MATPESVVGALNNLFYELTRERTNIVEELSSLYCNSQARRLKEPLRGDERRIRDYQRWVLTLATSSRCLERLAANSWNFTAAKRLGTADQCDPCRVDGLRGSYCRKLETKASRPRCSQCETVGTGCLELSVCRLDGICRRFQRPDMRNTYGGLRCRRSTVR